ncbi:MAG: fibrobacter succinogenes major paralogous domain-containing protein [Acholeplasmataceae bacterium]
MKAIVRIGLWKAIAFLTAAIFSLLFFACCNNDEPVLLKPTVAINSIVDVTANQAVLIASVVPNGEATVSIEYYPTLNPDQKVDNVMPTKYNGVEVVSVIIPLSGLEPNAVYNFTITVINAAGSVNKVGTFSTGQLTKAVAIIKPATNVTRFEATLNAIIIANQPETKVTFKYWTDAETTPKTKTLPTLYNGTDSLNVSADINDLPPNTKIYYQAEVENKAGLVVSNKSGFETYAVVDYDGNLYHTISYSGTYTRDYDGQKDVVFTVNQTWLRENFKGTHYANGDPIPNVANAGTWDNLTTGAYCQYNNDPKIAEVYGNLYNFYVGVDPRGLIVGWHTPTVHEFVDLGNYLADGATYKAGPMMMETGTAHWINPNPYWPPTNSSGFTALPNGAFATYMDTSDWVYMNLGESATFWTTNSEGSISGHMVEISRDNCSLIIGAFYHKTIYCGLRLIKNRQ